MRAAGDPRTRRATGRVIVARPSGARQDAVTAVRAARPVPRSRERVGHRREPRRDRDRPVAERGDATARRRRRAGPPPRTGRGTPPGAAARAGWPARSRSRSRTDPAGGQRGGHAGGLAGHPALRDLPEEGVRAGVAGDVPARRPGCPPARPGPASRTAPRCSGPSATGSARRRSRRPTPWPVSHCSRVTRRRPRRRRLWRTPICGAPSMRYACSNPGACGPVDLEVPDHQLARAELDRRQVLHVDGAVAGQPRPHEERHLVAPAHERLLEEPEPLAAARHELREPLRVPRAERDPAVHVHAAEEPRGVDAVVDVALVDVGVERAPASGEEVRVAGGVHHHPGPDGLAALLALEDRPLDHGPSATGATAQACRTSRTRCSSTMSMARGLEPLGVDGGRPGDDAVEGRRALGPVGGRRLVPGAPGVPRGPKTASRGSRSISSSATPRITWRPVQSVMRSIQMTRPPVESPPRWL